MKYENAFTVDIYVGFQEQYSGVYHTYEELVKICKEYCNEVKLCVSIQKVDFVYVDGAEEGAKITLINYPRFPQTPKEICLTARALGTILMKSFKQYRVSVVTPKQTIMLENDELLGG